MNSPNDPDDDSLIAQVQAYIDAGEELRGTLRHYAERQDDATATAVLKAAAADLECNGRLLKALVLAVVPPTGGPKK